VIGFLTAIVCALCQDVNAWLHIDEGLEVFKLHGIGGMVGSFLTGIFATSSSTLAFSSYFPALSLLSQP
jgi:Amt family ammonium transporter